MAKKIKICDLRKEYPLIKAGLSSCLSRLFKSHAWVLGDKLEEFEHKAASFLGVKYALGVASGTDALILALQALARKLKKQFTAKDEIITTPFSFIATAEAILRAGAKPVFVDIDPYTLNIDPRKIKKAVSKNTVGILPVHLYGRPADMDAVMAIAKAKGLFVIEDCAQSFGAEVDGKKTGSFGLLGCFSFFPSKNLGAYGDGGLVSTNDSRLFKYLKALRNHGQVRSYRADFLGYNSRLDSIQACVLLEKLKHVSRLNSLRREKAAYFNRRLAGIREISVLPFSSRSIYHLYTVRVKKQRRGLLEFLRRQGIEARVYYPFLLPDMEPFRAAKSASLKNARAAVREVISLPLHPFISFKDIDYITAKIEEFYS